MPPTKRVLVLGSGFAGLWAALGAARRLDELGAAPDAVDVTVISAHPYHDIRVRNYEADLSACRIPLQELLDPAGVGHLTAEVTGIDFEKTVEHLRNKHDARVADLKSDLTLVAKFMEFEGRHFRSDPAQGQSSVLLTPLPISSCTGSLRSDRCRERSF